MEFPYQRLFLVCHLWGVRLPLIPMELLLAHVLMGVAWATLCKIPVQMHRPKGFFQRSREFRSGYFPAQGVPLLGDVVCARPCGSSLAPGRGGRQKLLMPSKGLPLPISFLDFLTTGRGHFKI